MTPVCYTVQNLVISGNSRKFDITGTGTASNNTATGGTTSYFYLAKAVPYAPQQFWGTFGSGLTFKNFLAQDGSLLRFDGSGNAKLGVSDDGSGNVGWTITPGGAGLISMVGTSITITQAHTPGHTDACTAGTQWWDTSFIYICTASGTVKRATLNTY